MGEITLDPLPIDHESNVVCWVDMLVDFISSNSSGVRPKHVKAWPLSKKVVFHFFFTVLADFFFDKCVRTHTHTYIYIYIMYSWMGISLVLCFKESRE